MFVHPLRARPQDIDELGHVSNLRYLHWVLDAATAHAASVGLNMAEFKRIGAVFVVRRHDIQYRKPALAGDEITVRTWIEDWRPASSTRKTEIAHAHSGDLLARASTQWALVDFRSRRPVQIPREISDRFRP